MDMGVDATGASAPREYQKQTAAGASADFPEAARQTLPAPAEGKHVSSLPGFRKLSNEEEAALRQNFGAQNLKDRNASFAAMAKELLAMQEYGNAMSKRAEENQQMTQGFFSKMQKELGGAQTAMAIPNDPLGPEPVRTSSGGIHPQSERIKEYIRTHKDEWDSVSAPIPSFEEWQRTLI